MPSDGRVETDSTKIAQTTTAPPVDTGKTGDVESQTTLKGSGASKIVYRWRRYDVLKKGSLALRVSSFIFSLISFIIMTSNVHGDWQNFEKYEEYRYVFAISILSTFYTALQAFFQFNELSSGREFITRHQKLMLDFSGDQVLAYLLLSASSFAVPLTNKMLEEISTNIFTESSTIAISMEFCSFFALATSALFSGFKLSNKSYI
ncbi:hypothetical protein Leryth_003527 [Lithospermum erythrorhizon]|nr:hypothetical protein Leryth_003527 [Lithospermum erythrorhizon]